MTPVFADSFFFFALLNSNDAAHEAAENFISQAARPFVTTAWVLTEVADGCATVDKRGVFLQLFDALRESSDARIIGPSEDLFSRGLELYRQRPDKEWSLTDCLSSVAMGDERISEALTGDHHFEQAGFRALLRH
jgi:predicted nucleic acid-binding protein